MIHPNNIRRVFHVARLDCLFCLHFVYCTRFPAQQLCIVLVIIYFEINHLLWLRYVYKLFEKGHSLFVGLKMKVKCLPLGGLGRGGTLFLGGRAGMSCFLLKGSSTKPCVKSQWKGEAEGRYQGIRCKPRKLWAEQSIKTTSYKCHAANT